MLGIIRPTVETLGSLTVTRHVGILATSGTIRSLSYPLEIKKLFPDIVVTGEACPMWVPLVENGEAMSDGADYFVRQHIDSLLARDPDIDTIVLGCTHYPLLYDKIRRYTPDGVQLVRQGDLVADSLADYLSRHADMDACLTREATVRYLTTESPDTFRSSASVFLPDTPIHPRHINLTESDCFD